MLWIEEVLCRTILSLHLHSMILNLLCYLQQMKKLICLEMFQQFMPDFKIYIGNIDETLGVPEGLNSPFYATGVGIMQFACFEESRIAVMKEGERVIDPGSSKGFISKIKNMISR